MGNNEYDPAKELTDNFKKKGHFDKIKQEIVVKELSKDGNGGTVEQFVKQRVTQIVNGMVKNDETLIFKNRGSTSALIEAQLFKDGYEKLNNEEFDLEKFIDQETIDNKGLQQRIKEMLSDKNT